jgi:cell division protein FtsZ
MGGGTGTGSAPVIAQLASNAGALTVAVVTRPFSWEGKKREQNAKYGLDQLIEATATLIVVPNDNLLDHLPENVSLEDAFREADDVLRQGVQGISDLITRPGDINLDYEDARTVLAVGGKAVMGMGIAAGEGRAIKAAEKAANNPLLEDGSIRGARNILVNFTGNTSIGLLEVKKACDFIREQAHPEANLIFGTSVDPGIGDEISVTVVAASFEAPELGVLHRPAFQVAEGGNSMSIGFNGKDGTPGAFGDCLRGQKKDDSDPGVVEADLTPIKAAKDYESYQTPTWLRKRRD